MHTMRGGKLILVVATVLFVAGCGQKAPPATNHAEQKAPIPKTIPEVGGQWVEYSGSWFGIEHPKEFKAKPLEPKYDSDDPKFADRVQTDIAYFAAPDQSVEFMIYSPQWSGTIPELQPLSGESLSSERVDTNYETGDPSDGEPYRKITWRTFAADDGTYMRSIMDVQETFDSLGQEGEPEFNIRWVFGYKYENDAAYHKHLSQYRKFRESLEQFAD